MGRTVMLNCRGDDITCMKVFDALEHPCSECDVEDCTERETCGNDVRTNIYKEFEHKCNQKGLWEIFETQSQATYFLMMRLFEEKKIKFLGIGDDWNGKYEIRFSIH